MITKEARIWDQGGHNLIPTSETEKPIISYTHEYGRQKKQIQITQEILGSIAQAEPTEYCVFRMKDDNADTLGYTIGYLINQKGESIYESDLSINTQRDPSPVLAYEFQHVQVPRVVSSGISQIIKNGVVDIWYSSYSLEPMGKQMYRNVLGQDPELRVTRYLFEGKRGYVVSLRNKSIT